MRIALDVEGVLANTNEAVLQSTEKISRERLVGNWHFTEKEWQIYMGASDAIWRHSPEKIPPEENLIDTYVEDIADGNTVDILTGRLHVDESIQWWLAEHGVEYNDFISTGKDKWTFEQYDLFIDDNPEMIGNCNLLLRDQGWNNEEDLSKHPDVQRVYSLAEVTDHI